MHIFTPGWKSKVAKVSPRGEKVCWVTCAELKEKRTLSSCIIHYLNVGSRDEERAYSPFQRGIVGLHANLSHLFVISPRAENFNSGLSPGWNFTPGWNLVIFNSVWHVTPLVWYYETRVESYPGLRLSFDEKYFTPGWKYACNEGLKFGMELPMDIVTQYQW